MLLRLKVFLLIITSSCLLACPQGGGGGLPPGLGFGSGPGLGDPGFSDPETEDAGTVDEGGGGIGDVGGASDFDTGPTGVGAGDEETTVASAEGGGTVDSPTMPEWIERIRRIVRIIEWPNRRPWLNATEFLIDLNANRIASDLIRSATVFYRAGDANTIRYFAEDDESINSLTLEPGYYLIFGIKAEFADDDSVQFDASIESFNSIQELKDAVEDPIGTFLGDRYVAPLPTFELSGETEDDNPFEGLELSDPESSPKKKEGSSILWRIDSD